MTVTTTDALETTTRTAAPAGLWRTGLVATAIAAASTTVVAAIASAADVPLAIEGEEIPVAGFATMTALWSAVGIVMAWAMGRWTPRPRATFVATTVVLTLVSFLPSVTADTDTATTVVLCLTHVLAAAIVIPMLASRLPDRRPAR